MSREKPWPPHYFSPMGNRPRSCLVCGENALHEHHPGPLMPEDTIVFAVNRPPEAIFSASAKFPADGAARHIHEAGAIAHSNIDQRGPKLQPHSDQHPKEDRVGSEVREGIPDSARLMHGEMPGEQYEEFSASSMQSSYLQQQEVLIKALHIFGERNKVRRDLWTQADPLKNLDMVREKVNRVEAMMQGGMAGLELNILVDDALDCINYMTFVIRKLTGMVPGD